MYRLIHPFNYKSVIEKKLSLFHFILESSPLCNTCYSLLGTQLYNIRQNYWIITTQFSCKDIKLIYSLKKWKKTCFEELVEQTCLIDLWSPGTRSLFCRIEQLNWISKTITIFLTEHVPKNQLPWNTVEVSIVPFLWRRRQQRSLLALGRWLAGLSYSLQKGKKYTASIITIMTCKNTEWFLIHWLFSFYPFLGWFVRQMIRTCLSLQQSLSTNSH